MELCQMSSVQGLVPENFINGEEFARSEDARLFIFLCQSSKVPAAHRRGVGSQNVASSHSVIKLVSPPCRPLVVVFESRFVYLFNPFHVFNKLINFFCVFTPIFLDLELFRVSHEESVVLISSWMLLGLKKRIKISEAGFDVAIRLHFLKSHFQKDIPKLAFHFIQWVQTSDLVVFSPPRLEVQTLKLTLVLPSFGLQVFNRNICLEFRQFRSKVGFLK